MAQAPATAATTIPADGPRTRPRQSRRPRWLSTLLVLPLAVGVLPVVTAAPAAAADDWLYRPAGGVFAVTGHGEGHGRGMSQYGAQGAALQGRSYDQILDFYYPGTASVRTDPNRQLRIWVSSDTDNTTDVLRTGDLSVTDGAGTGIALPGNADLIRTVVLGGGFVVQARIGGGWSDISGAVSGPVRFRSADQVQVLLPSGDRAGYRDVVQAVRKGAGAVTVNVTALDNYVRGVVPRESISSWQQEALRTQAVAARTYASVRFDSPLAAEYDICDTGACQVFGGASRNGAALEVASTDTAVAGTAGVIRTYNGRPINAQFGSTNGGWTVAGGVPYLIAQPDPYEAAANPPQAYANWKGTLTVASLESRFPSIGSFTRLRITARDGNGDWGGRVVSATVEGSAGTANISGDQLRLALTAQVRSAWFQISDPDAGSLPVGSLDGAVVQGTLLRASGWAFDFNAPGAALQVHLYDYAPGGRTTATVLTADGSRPDVGRVFPGAGDGHGFSANIPIYGRGAHTVCAFGINVGAGSRNALLGCATVQVRDPFGSLDTVSASPGAMSLAGWSVDPDAPSVPTRVDVYDVGPTGTRGYGGTSAAGSRPDVAAVIPLAGGDHGFGLTIPITEAGNHRVCAYAISVNPGGANPALGCRDIRYADPIGSIDGARSDGSGRVAVSGWALDPIAPNRAVQVHVYFIGPGGQVGHSGILADRSRPDVGAAFAGTGDNHGVATSLTAPAAGATSACMFAIAEGANLGNRLLGCVPVTG